MKYHFETVLPPPGASFSTELNTGPVLDCLFHVHPECELTLVESGFGTRFIGSSLEPFSELDLVLIGGMVPHHYLTRAADSTGPEWSRTRTVKFLPGFCGKDLLDRPEAAALRTLLGEAGRGLHVPPEHVPGLLGPLRSLFDLEGLPKLLKLLEIPDAIAAVTAKYAYKTKIPADFCYLDGRKMQEYLDDLRICQRFASLNRRKIAEEIIKFLKIHKYTSFETVHNFIDEDNIIRKGAIPAHAGQRVLIPMNMRDGCLIAVGKGNEDWNCSAPHGAGRLCRRSEAKRLFTVEEFEETMRGVYTTTANESTLDESPMAYKPMREIVELISPTVEIERIIKPVYNFKAAE